MKENKNNSIWKEFLDFIKEVGISLLVVLLVMHFIAKPVIVKGSSMYPTLQDGDFAFSNILGVKMNKISRFDIVIIHIPEKNEYIVKRVIGLPGETVEYKDDKLYIDGEYVEEPFLDESYTSTYSQFTSDIESITLGDDEYYCLGDNRPNSSDSRVYGPFKKDKITSKGLFIFFPFKDFNLLTW